MTDRVNSAGDDRTANNAVRHQYRVLNDAEKAAMVQIKDEGEALLLAIDAANEVAGVKAGREMAIARTKVEEAVMWAVKGLTK